MMRVVERYEISVCLDCAELFAHGKAAEGVAEQVEAAWPTVEGWRLELAAQGDDEYFSWSHCEGCGSTLGGTRLPAVALRVAEGA